MCDENPGRSFLVCGIFWGYTVSAANNEKGCEEMLFLSSLFLLWASAQEQGTTPPPSTQSQEPPARGVFPTPPPLAVAPPEAIPPSVFPVRLSNPPAFAQAPLPAAFAPAIETVWGSRLCRGSLRLIPGFYSRASTQA